MGVRGIDAEKEQLYGPAEVEPEISRLCFAFGKICVVGVQAAVVFEDIAVVYILDTADIVAEAVPHRKVILDPALVFYIQPWVKVKATEAFIKAVVAIFVGDVKVVYRQAYIHLQDAAGNIVTCFGINFPALPV